MAGFFNAEKRMHLQQAWDASLGKVDELYRSIFGCVDKGSPFLYATPCFFYKGWCDVLANVQCMDGEIRPLYKWESPFRFAPMGLAEKEAKQAYYELINELTVDLDPDENMRIRAAKYVEERLVFDQSCPLTRAKNSDFDVMSPSLVPEGSHGIAGMMFGGDVNVDGWMLFWHGLIEEYFDKLKYDVACSNGEFHRFTMTTSVDWFVCLEIYVGGIRRAAKGKDKFKMEHVVLIARNEDKVKLKGVKKPIQYEALESPDWVVGCVPILLPLLVQSSVNVDLTNAQEKQRLHLGVAKLAFVLGPLMSLLSDFLSSVLSGESK